MSEPIKKEVKPVDPERLAAAKKIKPPVLETTPGVGPCGGTPCGGGVMPAEPKK